MYYQLYYRLTAKLSQVPQEYERLSMTSVKSFPEVQMNTGAAAFRFLNLTHDFGSIAQMDWNFRQYGKLWTYNLNYFDFIRKSAPEHVLLKSPEIALLLIEDWIDKAPTLQDAHEPYPTSLRIMNWLGFYAEQGLPLSDRVRAALRIQYDDLWTKREFHLMGNHLLENAIALVRGAVYFEDQQRLPQALELLLGQLKEQYRPEGAHFELSGAYHCTLLGRLLELYMALTAALAARQFTSSFATSLASITDSLVKQLSWLQYFTDANGHYPHFNDSVAGIAPTPESLFSQAQNLGLNPSKIPGPLIPAYYHARSGELDLWLDLGPIGPDYIPGHGHADNLTFCLTVGGRPFIVDPAISTYEANETRLLERSTCKHNTVSHLGNNSSEVWGAFRCGRRAITTLMEVKPKQIKASHDGYRYLGKRHERNFSWTENSFTVKDRFSGKGIACFHFAPGLTPNLNHEITMEGWRISWRGNHTNVELQPYECARGFNQLVPAWRLVITFTERLEVRFEQNLADATVFTD